LSLSVGLAGLAAEASAQTAAKSQASTSAKSKTPAKTQAAKSAKPSSKTAARQRSAARQERVPSRPSEGMQAGLHRTQDDLDLKSSVALVVDQDTHEVLFQKNPDAVLPIASITKLMTALVTVEAGLSLDEELTVTAAERVRESARSRLQPGVKLTRGQAMHIALMASDNRAAHLLGRTYPGGLPAFAEAMNAKARLLGMADSNFAEPTGLSAENRSSAQDLVRLATAAYQHPVIRDFSTSSEAEIAAGRRTVRYGSTNRLIANPNWDIGLQKTGFTSAAGRCLVMQVAVEGQRVMLVLLDSVGKYSRLADAERIRSWLEAQRAQRASLPVAVAAPAASKGDPLKDLLAPVTSSASFAPVVAPAAVAAPAAGVVAPGTAPASSTLH
jgi:D-alanyl-D-alanine endopeptidase (penicillin-binding protein 7)